MPEQNAVISKKCEHCGCVIPSNSKFCKFCGAPQILPLSQTPPQETTRYTPVQPEYRKKRSSGIIAAVIVSCAVIIVGVFAVLKLISDDSASSRRSRRNRHSSSEDRDFLSGDNYYSSDYAESSHSSGFGFLHGNESRVSLNDANTYAMRVYSILDDYFKEINSTGDRRIQDEFIHGYFSGTYQPNIYSDNEVEQQISQVIDSGYVKLKMDYWDQIYCYFHVQWCEDADGNGTIGQYPNPFNETDESSAEFGVFEYIYPPY